MKSQSPLLLFYFLLLSFSTKPSIADQVADEELAARADHIVYDTDGDILRPGAQYYILPVFRGRGGGLTMGTASGKPTCPLDVIQEPFELLKGLPVTFAPANSKIGFIPVSTDLNIKFSGATICVQSNVWKLLKSSNPKKQWSVTTNGVEGNPSVETVFNWFQIRKFDDDYKLTFCPVEVCHCRIFCRDISIYHEDNGTRSLALNGDVPFKVKFKKVPKSSS